MYFKQMHLSFIAYQSKMDFTHVLLYFQDLPTTLPEGMVVGSVSERGDPRDAVIMHPKHSECTLATLPKGSVIGEDLQLYVLFRI